MRIAEPPLRHPRPGHRHGQSGIAMVTAMMVIFVASLIAVLGVTLALHAQSASQVDRKRAQSVSSAEAGVDLGLIKAQSATLPCTDSGTLSTQPTTSTYSVTYTYYPTYPPSGTPLSCDPTTGVSGTPAAVLIKSMGSTSANVYGNRTLESLAKLTPIPGNQLSNAIYSAGVLNVKNNTTVNGNLGNDGDIYTNKDFTCLTSLLVYGSVYTQGLSNMSNSCAVKNDVYAAKSSTMQQSSSVGHDLKAAGGNITLSNSSTVGHDAIASGTVTAPAGAVGNNTVSGASLPPPPTQSFPQIIWDPTAWGADPFDFTNVITNNTCSGAGSVYNTIAGLSSATSNTAVITSCALSWPPAGSGSNSTSISFNHDVAIFSTGGFTANNNFTMQSTVAGTKHNLYWIVPYNAATPTCTSPGITTSNQSSFIDLNVFFYSPCNIDVANKTTTTGQVYGGSNVTIENQFTLTFLPIPVTGIQNSATNPVGYKVDIVYEREVPNS